jgi:outer membrane immunogenic protein
MKEYWLAAIALPVLVAGPAVAADMELRGSASPIVPLSWTGCYTGANVGWVGSRDEITLAPSGNYLNPAGVAPPPNPAGTGLNSRGPALVTNSYSARISGIEAGPQVGCNWQTGDFVFGGEADIQWTNLNNSVDANFGPIAAANAAFTIAPHTEHVTSRLD